MSAILIIDHDPPGKRRYDAMLDGMSIDVLTAAKTGEALAKAGSAQQPIEVILLRWELSEDGKATGTELLCRLRDQPRKIPVIVISDSVSLKAVQAATLLGAVDFLMFPLDRERLRGAIWRVLRGTNEPELLPELRKYVIGESPALIGVLSKLAQFIPNPDVNILLIGESGTGKELLAQAVHDLGPGSGQPLVARSVADFPEHLIESELFGHSKGSFTGAIADRQGAFEEVGQGTLFLDEIGELQPHLQTKLLRVLESKMFRPVGGSTDKRFAGRLVSATNKNLANEVANGGFRRDLFFRLNACELHIPPLRERDDDLWLLIQHLKERFSPNANIQLVREARILLERYSFPGNVRELSNIIHHAIVRCNKSEILLDDLPLDAMQQQIDERSPEGSVGSSPDRWPQECFEMAHKEATALIERGFNRQYLQHCREAAGGNITKAAQRAGIDPKTFRKKWKEAGLPPLSARD